jgi:uncharacterized protein (DUF58 family)
MAEPVSTRTSAADELLSSEFMQKLDQLDVLSRKVLQGKLKGERRSKQRGQSVEFADYRNYVVGDDLRFIDWNLYARLDRLFLRLFTEEQDLAVSILFDVSGSMDFGDPSKLDYARRLAAALGYIGLVNYNRVSVSSFCDSIVAHLPNLRGRRPIRQMLDFIATQQPQTNKPGDLVAACHQFVTVHRARGIVILISDFLDKGDVTKALGYLAGDRYDTYALQLLAPQELDPAKGGIVGDLRLRDVEDGQTTEVSISPALLKRYRANLKAFCQDLRQVCVRRDIVHLLTDTAVPFDKMVLKFLRERGLLG